MARDDDRDASDSNSQSFDEAREQGRGGTAVAEPRGRRPPDLHDLARRTYRSDSIVSTVLGLISVVALLFVGVVAVWLSTIEWRKAQKQHADVQMVDVEPEDGEEGAAGPGMDFTGGGTSVQGENTMDTVEVSEVRAEEIANTPQVGDPSQMLTDMIGNIEAQTDITGPSKTSGTGGAGLGEGAGGTGEKGFGPGSGVIPRGQRWTITFDGGDTNVYSAQLDAFGIEIGVVRGIEVTYVSQFSSQLKTRKLGPDEKETRVFFIWKEPERKNLDARLIAGASVSTADAIVAHFYPGSVVLELERLEKAFANREKKQIRLTRFAIRGKGDGGYEFFVESQTPK
jgi:hypothetical protein